MKILIIPSGDWLSPLPTRHKFLAEILARRGHEIHVLRIPMWSGGESSVSWSNIATIHELKGVKSTRQNDGNEILHYATRIAAYASLVRRVVTTESIDVILSSNLLPSAAAAIVARMLHVPVVYDVIDFYPDFVNRYARNGAMRGMLRYIADKVFDFNLRTADRLIFLGGSSAEILAEYRYAHVSSKPVAILPNGVSKELLARGYGLNKVRDLYSRGPKDLNVAMVGSLEFWIDAGFIVDFITRLVELDSQATLTIYGKRLCGNSTNVSKDLERRLNEEGVRHAVKFRGFVPYEEICQELEFVQIGLVPFRTDLTISHCASPIKLLEYLATGALVVATPTLEVVDLARNTAIIEKEGRRAAEEAYEMFHDAERLSGAIERGIGLAQTHTWDTVAVGLERELQTAAFGGS